MLNIYQKIWIIFVLALVYFNLFMIVKDLILYSFYPYLLATVFIVGLLLIGIYFINIPVVLIVFEWGLIIVLLLSLFTGLQIWRNTSSLRNYETEIGVSNNQERKIKNHKGIANLVSSIAGSSLTYNNQVDLIFEQEKMFDRMLEEINKAEDYIYIQFYIIRADSLGQRFKDLLASKVKAGVEVKLIYDALGSHTLKRDYIKGLEKNGIEVRAYNSFLSSLLTGKLNHRNHRKSLIIDGGVAFIGDVNLGQEYIKGNPRKSILMELRGEILTDLKKFFLEEWYSIKGEELPNDDYEVREYKSSSLAVQVVNSSYDTQWEEMKKLYLGLITTAEQSIYIVTPYLIPDSSLLESLQLAALRGVEVRVILSQETDSFLLNWSNISFYGELLRAGIELYRYEDRFLHAKAIVVDRETFSLGSANFNSRSLYLDSELNAVVYDQDLAEVLLEELKSIVDDSEELSLADYLEGRTLWRRLQELIGRFLVPLT